MKKILIIMFIASGLFGQKISELDEITSPVNSYNMLLSHDGVANYKMTLANLASWMFGSNRTMSGTLTLGSALKLAPLTSTTTANGIFMNTSTGKPAYNYNGTIYNLVNSNDLIPYSLGDTTNFANVETSNEFSATNTFNSIVDITTGTLYIPFETSAQSDSLSGNMRFYFNQADSLVWLNAKDASNDKFALQIVTKDYLENEFALTGSYLLAAGTQTALSSTLTWSSGTITPNTLSFGASGTSKSMIAPMDDYSTIAKSAERGSWFYDDTADRLYFHNGSSWVKFEDANYVDAQDALKLTKTELQDSLKAQTYFFSTTVAYPSDSENIVLFRAPFELEIDSVHAVLSGTASCSSKVNIEWGDSRTTADAGLFYGDQWVTSTTGEAMTGDVYSSIIYQGEWVWFKTSGITGTVYDVNLTITYTKR